MPRCCLNFQSMRTQAESTYIAHNMFGQIKIEIPWYINRHTLISRKRDGKPRMIGGQFVVVRVGVHQLSVPPNTSHPMLCHAQSLAATNRVTEQLSWWTIDNFYLSCSISWMASLIGNFYLLDFIVLVIN